MEKKAEIQKMIEQRKSQIQQRVQEELRKKLGAKGLNQIDLKLPVKAVNLSQEGDQSVGVHITSQAPNLKDETDKDLEDVQAKQDGRNSPVEQRRAKMEIDQEHTLSETPKNPKRGAFSPTEVGKEEPLADEKVVVTQVDEERPYLGRK